jgi:hypothetical protein
MTHPSWFLARFGASRPLLPSRGRTLVLLAGVVGFMAWGAAGLRAQEVEVPFDDAGRVLVINANLARQLGLFGEVTSFREARLFQLPDGSFLLEVTSAPGGHLTRERRSMTADEAQAFRRTVMERLAARAPRATLDQSGRTKLLGEALALGVGFYGWATAVVFDPSLGQTWVAIYMLTAASTFVVPFLATRTQPVSDADATMSLWGASRGPIHGLLASFLGDARKAKTILAWSVAVGASEAVAGGLASHALRMTSGRAELTGLGGDVGSAAGFGVAHLLRLDQRYRTVGSQSRRDHSLQALVTLGGTALGLAGGYALGGTETFTRGDVNVLRNVTGIGASAGLAVADLVQQPELVTVHYPDGSTSTRLEENYTRTHTAGILLGGAAGAFLGHRLVTGRNFTTRQSTLLGLSSTAGAMVGLGLAYVATPGRRNACFVPPCADPNDHSELYLVATTLGAGVGFAALYPSLARQAKAQEPESPVQLSLNPLALGALLAGAGGPIPLGAMSIRFE